MEVLERSNGWRLIDRWPDPEAETRPRYLIQYWETGYMGGWRDAKSATGCELAFGGLETSRRYYQERASRLTPVGLKMLLEPIPDTPEGKNWYLALPGEPYVLGPLTLKMVVSKEEAAETFKDVREGYCDPVFPEGSRIWSED
jgi:hypothetical protein